MRALIANKIELLDGYVSMDVQGQYVNTGCPENETWKTELGLAVNGASGNWSSIVCGTIDQFTIGRENNNGGTIRAKADDTILKDFGNIVLKAGGLVIDTQGHNLDVMNCVLNVVPGGKITVTGGGTVSFANCTASLTAKPSEKFLFADTDGVFSGMPTYFVVRPPTAGQTLTVTGVPMPTNLPNGWKVSVSANGTGRIMKRGFMILVK